MKFPDDEPPFSTLDNMSKKTLKSRKARESNSARVAKNYWDSLSISERKKQCKIRSDAAKQRWAREREARGQ